MQVKKNVDKIKNICELEDEILLEKENFIEKYFYYEAGRACNQVLNKALEQDDCNGVNGCFGGLISFENFLGI